MNDNEYTVLEVLGSFHAMVALAGEVLSLEEVNDEPYSDLCPLCEELWFVPSVEKTTAEMTRDDYIDAFINHADLHFHIRDDNGSLFGRSDGMLQ